MSPGLLGSLFRASGRRLIRRRPGIHLPDCLTEASTITVLSGPGDVDVWSALVLCNNLQRHFRGASLTVLCPERDAGLFSILEWLPEIVAYDGGRGGRGGGSSAAAEGPSRLFGSRPDLLFVPYDRIPPGLTLTLLRIEPSVFVSFAADDAVNLEVRIGPEAGCPERIHRLCEVLGFGSDRKWRPSVTAHDSHCAAELLAPVSGRALPYIFASPGAAEILTKCHEEVPLKLVRSSGRDSILEGVDRSVRAALVQDSTVVATDEPSLWVEACFLGVPAVGLDPKGCFPNWGDRKPAGDRVEFLEKWENFITEGWQ